MVTDVNELIRVCTKELEDRQYRPYYVRLLAGYWETLAQWMETTTIAAFTEKVANQYCDLHIGSHVLSEEMDLKDKQHLRAIRMLVSYQKDGGIRCLTPLNFYKRSNLH